MNFFFMQANRHMTEMVILGVVDFVIRKLQIPATPFLTAFILRPMLKQLPAKYSDSSLQIVAKADRSAPAGWHEGSGRAKPRKRSYPTATQGRSIWSASHR